MNENRSRLGWIVGVIALVLLLCCCGGGAIASAVVWNNYQAITDVFTPTTSPITTLEPTQQSEKPPVPLPKLETPAEATLAAILGEDIPQNDPVATAFRLGWIDDLSRMKPGPAEVFEVGDSKDFWVLNQDTSEMFLKNAVVRKVTPHAYFWVQSGRIPNMRDLNSLAETFENEIYPTTRRYFGNEWDPGVDNDPHVFILYTDGLGEEIAGMFSNEDSLMKTINSYSNEHEMFYLSGGERLSDPYTYGVLAHEFNHMILWNQDANEDTWMAEGLADLASVLNGYDAGGFDEIFAAQPDLQLNTWPEDSAEQDAHYGSSFLFLEYLYSRFGEDFIKRLMTAPQNGFEGIDTALGELTIEAGGSGSTLSSEKVFGDWAVANFLNDPRAAEDQYAYPNDLALPAFPLTETSDCPGDWQVRSVAQFGTDYLQANCSGDFILEIDGDETVKLLSGLEINSNHFFWSNRSDYSQTTLSKGFDFTGFEGPIWMNYRAWYDLETDYDYAYVMASEDGEHWTVLNPTTCTEEDPVGANLGCGYTGQSDGWVNEEVDLSGYAGKAVTLAFVVVTDSAVTNEGLAIDDISIPGVSYQSDLEHDAGGWGTEGWVRVQNALPQIFEISVIRPGEPPAVERFSLTGGSPLRIPVNFNQTGSIDLVVSGTTRFVTSPADYRFRFIPNSGG